MTVAPALPLTVIADLLAGDCEYAAIIASEAAATLRPAEPAHSALMRSLRELADRLAMRHGELRATTDVIEADLSLARLGLLP